MTGISDSSQGNSGSTPSASDRARIAAALLTAYPKRYMPPVEKHRFSDIGADVQMVLDRIKPKEADRA